MVRAGTPTRIGGHYQGTSTCCRAQPTLGCRCSWEVSIWSAWIPIRYTTNLLTAIAWQTPAQPTSRSALIALYWHFLFRWGGRAAMIEAAGWLDWSAATLDLSVPNRSLTAGPRNECAWSVLWVASLSSPHTACSHAGNVTVKRLLPKHWLTSEIRLLVLYECVEFQPCVDKPVLLKNMVI